MEDRRVSYELSDYVLGKYFRETGTRQGWLPENGRPVSVATSGGGDSLSLLWMFRRFYHGAITAIHINHGIRGSESDEDERFTAMFAGNLGVNFRAVRVSVPSQRMKGESLETSARRIRLQALSSTARELCINSVMLGHNRDDLAETVLFNILRGTGLRGSVGMTEHTEHDGVTFYRPLLGMRREFLRDVLRSRGLSWREDSSNNSDEYTRNFIRLRLIPILEGNINASSVEHLARFGEDMRALRGREDEYSREILKSCLEAEGDNSMTLDRRKLKAHGHDDISLIIREAGRRLNLRTLSRRRCDELAWLILKPENFTFQWCGDMTVSGRKGKVFFEEGMNRQ